MNAMSGEYPPVLQPIPPYMPHPIVQGNVFPRTQAPQDNSDRQPLLALTACL